MEVSEAVRAGVTSVWRIIAEIAAGTAGGPSWASVAFYWLRRLLDRNSAIAVNAAEAPLSYLKCWRGLTGASTGEKREMLTVSSTSKMLVHCF